MDLHAFWNILEHSGTFCMHCWAASLQLKRNMLDCRSVELKGLSNDYCLLSCEFLRMAPHIPPWTTSLNHPWPYLTHTNFSWIYQTILDSFEYFLCIPLVVPLDPCLGVHLEVLTSSDPTWVITKKKFTCVDVWRQKNRVKLRSRSLSFEFLSLTWLQPSWPSLNSDLTFTWTWAGQYSKSKPGA